MDAMCIWYIMHQFSVMTVSGRVSVLVGDELSEGGVDGIECGVDLVKLYVS